MYGTESLNFCGQKVVKLIFLVIGCCNNVYSQKVHNLYIG